MDKNKKTNYRLMLQIDFGTGEYKDWCHIDVETDNISFWDQLTMWIRQRPKGTSPAEYVTLDKFFKGADVK